MTPVKTAFTSPGVLLTMIRVGFLLIYVGRLLKYIQDSVAKEVDYIEL